MQDNNELNDIILNKGGSSNSNKKIILAVATLGVILIIVVMLMNSLTSNGTDNLPQTPIPPQPSTQVSQEMDNEPLFEEVEVTQEEPANDNLDAIAKKLKEESQEKPEVKKAPVEVVEEPVQLAKPEPKPVVVAKPKPKPVAKVTQATTPQGKYYIQVGSFSKYSPNKKFLNSITSLGYKYTFHKVTKGSSSYNKVLVGPFNTSATAKDARRVLRAKVEPGAFLVKL